MPYLFFITCDDFETSMVYLRLLVVTEHLEDLDWDGFRALYRRHLGQTMYHAPPVCQDEPSVAQRRLDTDFLCDEDRAHQFFIDIWKAKEDFTLACLSCLIEGNCRTLYDPSICII